jgi:hypothetical protein
MSKQAKWHWGPEPQKAFEELKRLISKETLLAFPDFTKPFHVYTDASNYQLGAVIMQEGKPLAFYSRKLNSAQKNYTTGEQELLSIVETFKEFRNILLGQKIIVHTDHMNIVYGNLSNDRIVQWRLLLEEFGPEYHHIAGKDNVVANALSRLDLSSEDHKGKHAAECMTMLIRDEGYVDMPDPSDRAAMAEFFALDEEQKNEEFPMLPALIAEEQRKDKAL